MYEKDNIHNDYSNQRSMVNNLNALGMGFTKTGLGASGLGGIVGSCMNQYAAGLGGITTSPPPFPPSPTFEQQKHINARVYARGVRFRNPHMQVKRLEHVNKE